MGVKQKSIEVFRYLQSLLFIDKLGDRRVGCDSCWC